MIDSYGRNVHYLRLSVTDKCNLRCRYCMPEDGVCPKRHDEMLTEEEMVSAVRAAASLGIDKLRITGGEPLVKKNILSLCEKCAAVPGIREVCVTTNGTLLPELAKPLRAAGVQRLNISLDTLNAEKYAYITRRGTLESALRGIQSAYDAGFEHLKVNAVLIGGFNDDEIPALAELARYYPMDVRFIELMPIGECADWPRERFLSADAVLHALPELQRLPNEGVAERYRMPGWKGKIGLIRPMSHRFCADCDRIRVTADGRLKPCLHSAQEIPLRGLHGENLERALREGMFGKPVSHHMQSGQPSESRRGMSQIGG